MTGNSVNKYEPKTRDPRSNTGKELCSPEEFVKAWQNCSSLDEVRIQLGYKSLASVSARASKYRRNGVPLKYFTQQNRMPWFNLAEQARELLKPEDVTFQDD